MDTVMNTSSNFKSITSYNMPEGVSYTGIPKASSRASKEFHVSHFDSVLDAVVRVEREDLRTKGNSSRKDGSGSSFYEFDSFEESMRAVRNGWPKGLELMNSVAVGLSHTGSVGNPITGHALAGDALDMGRVMQGHPECWMHTVIDKSSGHGGKIKKIAFAGDLTAGNSREIFMRRGKVAAAIIDTLESMGFRCELHYIGNVHFSGEMNWTSIIVKRPEDALNKNLLSYVAASADMFRRVTFGVMERSVEFGFPNYVSYGSAYSIEKAFKRYGIDNPYDLIFDTTSGTLKDEYGSDERAIATYKKMITSYLADLEIDIEDIAIS